MAKTLVEGTNHDQTGRGTWMLRSLPDIARLLTVLGLIAFMLIKPPDGIADDKQAQPLFFQAFELLKTSNYAAAAEKFEQGLEHDPQNAQAHFYLGEAYRFLNKADKAHEHYEQSLEINDNTDVAGEARQRLAELAEVESTRLIQKKLNELGYDAGPADAVAGARTQEAIALFRRDSDLADDASLLAALDQAVPRASAGKSEGVGAGSSGQSLLYLECKGTRKLWVRFRFRGRSAYKTTFLIDLDKPVVVKIDGEQQDIEYKFITLDSNNIEFDYRDSDPDTLLHHYSINRETGKLSYVGGSLKFGNSSEVSGSCERKTLPSPKF